MGRLRLNDIVVIDTDADDAPPKFEPWKARAKLPGNPALNREATVETDHAIIQQVRLGRAPDDMQLVRTVAGLARKKLSRTALDKLSGDDTGYIFAPEIAEEYQYFDFKLADGTEFTGGQQTRSVVKEDREQKFFTIGISERDLAAVYERQRQRHIALSALAAVQAAKSGRTRTQGTRQRQAQNAESRYHIMRSLLDGIAGHPVAAVAARCSFAKLAPALDTTDALQMVGMLRTGTYTEGMMRDLVPLLVEAGNPAVVLAPDFQRQMLDMFLRTRRGNAPKLGSRQLHFLRLMPELAETTFRRGHKAGEFTTPGDLKGYLRGLATYDGQIMPQLYVCCLNECERQIDKLPKRMPSRSIGPQRLHAAFAVTTRLMDEAVPARVPTASRRRHRKNHQPA